MLFFVDGCGISNGPHRTAKDPALDRRFTAAQQRGDVDADAAEATG